MLYGVIDEKESKEKKGDLYKVDYSTGTIEYDIMEMSSEAKVPLHGVQCAIIMIDAQSGMENPSILDKYLDLCKGVPVVVLGSKNDKKFSRRCGNMKLASYIHSKKITYYEHSSITLYNAEKPWNIFGKSFVGGDVVKQTYFLPY